jgi:ribose transport system ATP-binding protein
MSVTDLRYEGCSEGVTFDLYSGEILGVAGLVGAGRTELMRVIFGIEPRSSGEMLIHGEPSDIRSPADAIRAGMGLVPEDRKALGVILEMCVSENITLPSIGSYNPPFMDRKREKQAATQQVAALDIRTPSLTHDVQFLSGGNQQKVALAKWLSLNPRILILDEPTRGIDVGSKSEIYKLVRKLADSGVAVMMVSSELEEIIGLADRVLVMHEGACTGILAQDQIGEENIMRLATGGLRPRLRQGFDGREGFVPQGGTVH